LKGILENERDDFAKLKKIHSGKRTRRRNVCIAQKGTLAAILSRSCPLWVRSGHRGAETARPLYPQKRTLLSLMIRLVPKADSCAAAKYVLHSITSSAREQGSIFVGCWIGKLESRPPHFALLAYKNTVIQKAKVISTSIAFSTRICGPAEQARYGPRVGNKTLCLRKPSRASHALLFVTPSMRVRIMNGE
jgi:hypothetical protein